MLQLVEQCATLDERQWRSAGKGIYGQLNVNLIETKSTTPRSSSKHWASATYRLY